MDIDVLSGLIKELIGERDSVTLPSLGIFFAEVVGASFADKGYSITPPYRRLSFRQRGEDEDNAIVRLYAQQQSEGLSKDEAERKRAEAEREVAEFMEGLKDVLLREKLVIFPGLGRLRATRENNIFFVQDEDLDIFPEGFGLEKISLKSLKAEATPITPIPVKDLSGPMESGPATPAPVPDGPHSAEAVSEALQAEPSGTGAAAVQAPETTSSAPEQSARHEAQEPGQVSLPERKRPHILRTVIISTFASAAVLAGALAILGRTCPQIIDPLLYSEEELAIINHPDA